MKRYAVKLSARAQADILEAIRWESNVSLARGEEWEALCENALNSLRSMPQRFPIAEDCAVEDFAVHRLIFGVKPAVYKIYFVVEGSIVDVLYCRHASRTEPESAN